MTDATSLACTEANGGVTIAVRVVPRASREAIAGVTEGALKVALTAPPVDGEANAALVAFLAKRLGVAKRAVVLVRGDTARSKVVRIDGVSKGELVRRIFG